MSIFADAGNCPPFVYNWTKKDTRFVLDKYDGKIHVHYGRLIGDWWVWLTKWDDGEIDGCSIRRAGRVLNVISRQVNSEIYYKKYLAEDLDA